MEQALVVKATMTYHFDPETLPPHEYALWLEYGEDYVPDYPVTLTEIRACLQRANQRERAAFEAAKLGSEKVDAGWPFK